MSKLPLHPRHAIIIPVEGFAGSLVYDVAKQMLALADRLETPVSCDVNGTHLLAIPGMKLADLKHDYEVQLASSDVGTAG